MNQGPVPTGMAGAAANPETAPETLRQIAYHYPQLRPVVAQNPAAYDGLLQWLHQLGDPAVEQALQARAQAAQQAAFAQAGIPAPGESQRAVSTTTPPLGVQAPKASGSPSGRGTRIAVIVLSAVALVLTAAAVGLFTGLIGGSPSDAESGAQPGASDTAPQSSTPQPTVDASEQPVRFPAPDGAVEVGAFVSPSGNIACALGEDSVRCSIYEQNFAQNGFEPCADGSNLAITDGSAGLECGTQLPVSGVTLEYGASARSGDVACASESEGISCWNQRTGQAFAMARSGWQTGANGRILPSEFRF